MKHARSHPSLRVSHVSYDIGKLEVSQIMYTGVKGKKKKTGSEEKGWEETGVKQGCCAALMSVVPRTRQVGGGTEEGEGEGGIETGA